MSSKMKLPIFRISYGKTNKINQQKNKEIHLKRKKEIKNKPLYKTINYRSNLYGCYYYEIRCPNFIKVLFYSCKLCSFTIVCKKTLLYHLKVKHPDIFPYTCRYCSAKFMMSNFCCNHEKKYHSSTCENCRWNLCCPTRLAEHWAVCVRDFVDRNTITNDNLVDACRWCDKCISEREKRFRKNTELLHIFKTQFGLEKTKTPFLDLKDTCLSGEVSFEGKASKSMPLLNDIDFNNVDCANSSNKSNCETVQSHYLANTTKENDMNSIILDLFGTISDSESDMGECINNNDNNCYDNNNDSNSNLNDNSSNLFKIVFKDNRISSMINKFESYSDCSNKIIDSNSPNNLVLNCGERSHNSNIENTFDSPKTLSFSIEHKLDNDIFNCKSNIEDYMKCYLCSFTTKETKLMADHWLTNHCKIYSKASSIDLNNYNIKETSKSQEEKRIQHIKSEIQRNIDYYCNFSTDKHSLQNQNIKHYNLRKRRSIKYCK